MYRRPLARLRHRGLHVSRGESYCGTVGHRLEAKDDRHDALEVHNGVDDSDIPYARDIHVPFYSVFLPLFSISSPLSPSRRHHRCGNSSICNNGQDCGDRLYDDGRHNGRDCAGRPYDVCCHGGPDYAYSICFHYGRGHDRQKPELLSLS